MVAIPSAGALSINQYNLSFFVAASELYEAHVPFDTWAKLFSRYANIPIGDWAKPFLRCVKIPFDTWAEAQHLLVTFPKKDSPLRVLWQIGFCHPVSTSDSLLRQLKP